MALQCRCQPTTTRRVSELKKAVQKQLQLQRNVEERRLSLRQLAANFCSWPAAESLKFQDVKAAGKAAKNNGKVGGMTYAIMPKTAEPPANKGCLIAMS
ncbi:hypothetical protein DYB35_011294 [Aphanomyces astaci]|uniref:Uncharacterized protein n=1 Tax=Aphanomyces astaci TaxID=112090 RepID=A0A3R7BNP6_APHAT|nr:hypothetical protein DYB35_011294 [Aphanomyces astaci]